jgi:hypothetical protein
VRGTSFGSVVLSTLHNHEAEIQNISFEGLLFTKSTRGSLDFIDSQPVLKIDMLNNGNLEARNPDFYEYYPVLDIWQITPTATGTVILASPSIIPTPVSIQIATALLLPSSESTHTPTTTPADRPHTLSLCPNLYTLAILPIVACCQRKLFASRRSQS